MMPALQLAWTALSIIVLGAVGMSALASAVQDGDWRHSAIGAGMALLGVSGIGLIR